MRALWSDRPTCSGNVSPNLNVPRSSLKTVTVTEQYTDNLPERYSGPLQAAPPAESTPKDPTVLKIRCRSKFTTA